MDRNLDQIEFTIFDTETTGLDPEAGDRIVEIAAVRFKGKQQIGTFESLVNPYRPISEGAFQVNKITPQMLKRAPAMTEVMPEFLKFIQHSCLCSYNAIFDLGFLKKELKLMDGDLPSDIPVVDILKMARRLMPQSERYALWFIAEKLGINIQQQHRALSDVELTLAVFNKLKERLSAKGILDFTNFLSLFALNSRFSQDINNQKIAKIQQAMDLGVNLRIKYISSAEAAVSEREVIPKAIRQEKNSSYLIGHCCLKKEERTFRIDGILHLEIL